jgi:hypothetical protein
VLGDLEIGTSIILAWFTISNLGQQNEFKSGASSVLVTTHPSEA